MSRYCDVKTGLTHLSNSHPGDVAYNIASAGNYAFHKKNATDPLIRDYLKNKNISIVEVKQGYSKCSTVIVNERSIITADNSIHTEALKNGFDSLLILPGYIDLPGYKYGFIGGATGRFKNSILFTGNIDHHPERNKIFSFIESGGFTVTLLSDEPALDTGSLLISSY